MHGHRGARGETGYISFRTSGKRHHDADIWTSTPIPLATAFSNRSQPVAGGRFEVFQTSEWLGIQ